MIPIISSLLIATTPHNFDNSELTEINNSQSSLVIAEENINPADNKSFSQFSPHNKSLALISSAKSSPKNIKFSLLSNKKEKEKESDSLSSSLTNLEKNKGNLPVTKEKEKESNSLSSPLINLEENKGNLPVTKEKESDTLSSQLINLDEKNRGNLPVTNKKETESNTLSSSLITLEEKNRENLSVTKEKETESNSLSSSLTTLEENRGNLPVTNKKETESNSLSSSLTNLEENKGNLPVTNKKETESSSLSSSLTNLEEKNKGNLPVTNKKETESNSLSSSVTNLEENKGNLPVTKEKESDTLSSQLINLDEKNRGNLPVTNKKETESNTLSSSLITLEEKNRENLPVTNKKETESNTLSSSLTTLEEKNKGNLPVSNSLSSSLTNLEEKNKGNLPVTNKKETESNSLSSSLTNLDEKNRENLPVTNKKETESNSLSSSLINLEENKGNLPVTNKKEKESNSLSSPLINLEENKGNLPVTNKKETESNTLSSSLTNLEEKNKGNLPVNTEKQPEKLISQKKLPPENTQINSISIPVENPPAITAGDLGKPLSLTINKPNYQFMVEEKSSLKFNTSKRLIITSRQGNSRQFDFNFNSSSFKIVQDTQENKEATETQENNQITETNANPQNNQIKKTNTNPPNVVEILADEQEYLDQQQIIKAKGNVVIRFSNGILIADEVLVNLVDRIAVAEGNVTLERGDQSLKGDRFEYYFVQDRGIIFNAKGEIYQPSIAQDFRGETANNPLPQQPLSWQFEANQPLRKVVSAEGISFAVGSIREYSLVGKRGGTKPTTLGGQVNRFRFQAERVDFESDSWNATNIRITNDPFSPPEFEIRANTAKLRNISPFQDELTTTKSRLVFDQRVSIPLFQDRLIFDRRNRRPGLFSIGFDGEDLGGLYIERDFEIYTDEKTIFTLTPQILLQRAFFPDSFFDDNAINDDDNGGLFNPSSFGLVAKLVNDFSDRTNLNAIINLTGLDLDNVDNRLRASIQLNQKVGDIDAPHNFSLQYNYRDRLFNGSLGFQTVQQSYGLVVTSPYNRIGQSGFGFVYQGSVQNVTADTDNQELLGKNPRNSLTNLTRFQGAGIVNGNILLWKGEPLPATAEEGLRYTSTPVAPYLSFNTGLTGVASYYSNGDTQPNLTATVGLEGQFGHFSNPFFDYTGFNVSFSQGIRGDLSPFFFDRAADDQVLSLGLTQQLYGPVRAGLQSFINVKTSQEISTDYFLEYSRRTYNIIVRYNPVLEIGSVNLRISDFNWDGNAAPFEGTGIRPVVDGVTRNN